MRSRRLLFALGLAAAAALGVLLRLHTRDQLDVAGAIRPFGSDDAYHLRRARFALENFPRTIVVDPLMNFPHGGVPIWPPLYDVLLAAPTRLLHGRAATPASLMHEAAWAPVVLAAGSILLAGLLGARLAGTWGGLAAALFLAVVPGHILWTQYGHVDQHAAENFFCLLLLWLFVRSCDRERALGREIATGVTLGVAVLCWQGAIAWGAAIALALFLDAAVGGRSAARPALAILASAAGVAAAGTAFWLRGAEVPFTYISFGWFQPLFLAALAAGTLALDTLLAALRRTLARREAIARLLALLLLAAVLLPAAGPLFGGLWRGVGYVLGRTSEVASRGGGYVDYPKDWLAGIFEARPLFADGLGLAAGQLSLAFFLAPVVVIVWAWRAWRGEKAALHRALAVWGGVILLLVLAQRLNVHYAAALTALVLVEAIAFVSRRLSQSPGREALARIAAGAAAVALLGSSAPALRAELSAVHVPGSDLFRTLDWMRDSLPREIDPYEPRLLEPGSPPPELSRVSAVLAPWSMGHLLLFSAERPVAANNFGYGFLDSIRFFLAETEEEALAIARQRRARWVVATDLTSRMGDYARYLDKPPPFEAGPGGLVPSRRYFSTLQARLYEFDGRGAALGDLTVEPLASFRLIYRSESAMRRGSGWVARWKVFEIREAEAARTSPPPAPPSGAPTESTPPR